MAVPALTVITPVYNNNEYISLCIENVLAQQCPHVEHLIIDGGSADGTVETIRKAAARYPHVRWVSEPDKGQSDAMNKGIGLAQSRVIGFLNADDYYEPGTLNRVCTIFSALPNNSFAVGNCRIWQSETTFDLNTPSDLRFVSLAKKKSVHPYNPAAYFYHKTLHDEVGMYDLEDHYSMDLDFILRVVRRAHCYYFDEVWGNMRLRPGSKTFEDNRHGQAMKRMKETMKRNWDKAPIWLKWRYNLLPYFHKFSENIFK